MNSNTLHEEMDDVVSDWEGGGSLKNANENVNSIEPPQASGKRLKPRGGDVAS